MSLHFFFLISNQKIAKPPEPATTVEPVTMPAIAPPESPSLSSSSPSSSVLGAELPTLEPPELPLPASPAGASSLGITRLVSSVPSSAKIEKVLAMDYRALADKMLNEFPAYVMKK